MNYTYEIEVNTSDIGDGFYANLIDTELNNFIISNSSTLNHLISFDRGEDINGVIIFTINIEYEI